MNRLMDMCAGVPSYIPHCLQSNVLCVQLDLISAICMVKSLLSRVPHHAHLLVWVKLCKVGAGKLCVVSW